MDVKLYEAQKHESAVLCALVLRTVYKELDCYSGPLVHRRSRDEIFLVGGA